MLDRGLSDAERGFHEYGETNRATAHAMKRALDILKSSRGSGQLVFGRVDRNGAPLYIGRRRVYDEHKDLVVVGWHTPAAEVFYEATPLDTRGVQLKRVFVEENRQLERVIDEIVQASASLIAAEGPDPKISDALLGELDRTRDGAMREVVATIQAEQFRIIRADRDCVLVVQGGPGTGKTVVGLHRAAWLTFNHEELRRQGLLVVAPSSAFLSYISGVLPSLDATDITQLELVSLYLGDARVVAEESPQTARVKGSGDMAAVLRRALAARTGWDGDDLELSLGATRVRVPRDEILRLVEETRRRRIAHNEARDLLRQSLSALAFRTYADRQREENRPIIANEATIRRLSSFTNALDRLWPGFTPEELLRSLYGTQAWLVDAAEGALAPDERARLFRPVQTNVSAEPWTNADLFCLDELAHLLNGDTSSYGHVVVDEAQDLSPMQARALARRCPSGSFTVLGDLAQATGPWVRDGWDELTEHLGGKEVRVETLSIGYRVPAAVLDLAAEQLPLISPGLQAPRSVRRGRGAPVWRSCEAGSLVGSALDAGMAATVEGMTTAVLVPDDEYDAVLILARSREMAIGDGRDGDFASQLTVVPAGLAKGLEFDSVILMAPDRIVGSGPHGRRSLYVAMTRCTQQLQILHESELPEGLVDPSASSRPAEAAPTGVTDAATTQRVRDDELSALVRMLNEQDRDLVNDLVVRLLLDALPSPDPASIDSAEAAGRDA